MAARECLYAVQESAYGTPKSTPSVGTDCYYFNLPDSDSFAGVMSPVFQEIADGGGRDILRDVRTDHYNTAINWKGFVYPTLDNFLINLACVPMSGGTSPWTSSEPAGDLASASFYHLWTPRGLTAVRKRFVGCKVASINLDCSRTDPKLRFSASMVAQKEVGNAIETGPPADPDATEFPLPTDAQIPTGPYLFSHSSANLSVGGAAITNYQSLSVKITNKLDVLFFESKFPSIVSFLGRRIEVTFQRLLTTATNYRTFFQGLTDKATYVKFDNGSNSFKLDLGPKCHVSAYTTQLGLGKEFLETITVLGRFDPTSGTDLTVTFT